MSKRRNSTERKKDFSKTLRGAADRRASIPPMPTRSESNHEARSVSGIPKATVTASAKTTETTYDDVPYPSHPYPSSHPNRLYSIARLFGLNPTHPSKARVLELGCAAGGNLIPIAARNPDSYCFGIDLSQVQCRQAAESIKKFGISNIDIRQGSILDLDQSLGKFDYILCHGVYSWVPPQVQAAILRVTSECLANDGVSYISYNVYPGWHMRSMIRGMVLKHSGSITDPIRKIEQARALLTFLVASTQEDQSPFAQYLRTEAEALSKYSDSYLFHEHLEEHNSPQYFRDFIADATKHQLQFLGEASLASMWIGNLPKAATQQLESLTNDIIARGQYSDFIRNRTFRQTLLVHQGRPIDRNLTFDRIRDARFCGNFAPTLADQKIDYRPEVNVEFRCIHGLNVSSPSPAYKAVAVALSEVYPHSLGITEMLERANAILQREIPERWKGFQATEEIVTGQLLQMILVGVLDISYVREGFTTKVCEKPLADPWARFQAEHDTYITSMHHTIVNLDVASKTFLRWLDGKSTVEDLIRILEEHVRLGKLSIRAKDGKVLTHQDLLRAVHESLDTLARSGLLIPNTSPE